jgi:iron complex outermembrane receptor protein
MHSHYYLNFAAPRRAAAVVAHPATPPMSRPFPCLSTVATVAVAGLATAAQAQTAADAAATLPAVEVVGRTASGAYHAGDAAGAKTELRLRELPQSVRVLTRQAIDDLGATKLDDLLDYVGGVSRQNNFGGLWDNVAVRGLAGNENTGMATLLNGFSSNRGFNPPPRCTAAASRAAR